MHVHHGRRQSFASFEAAPTPLRNRSNPGAVPLALRLRVYTTRGRLDRQLASGRLCESTAALALRARQLGDPRQRRQVARDLRGIVDYVDRVGSSRVISAVVIDRRAVRAGRQAIFGLAQRLEAAAPVSFRGVALTRALITDGLSPLFNPDSGQTVDEAISRIVDALEVSAFDPDLE